MKTSHLRVTGLCVGNSPVTGEQRPSNGEKVSIWWRHHAYMNSDMSRYYPAVATLLTQVIHGTRHSFALNTCVLYLNSY